MHGLAFNLKEELSFAQDLSLKKLCLALLHSVSYFFFLYQSPCSPPCSSKLLSINPFANVFIFGDFNVHHKDWLTYSGGTNRPGELGYNFSFSNDLIQMVNHRWFVTVESLIVTTFTVLLF